MISENKHRHTVRMDDDVWDQVESHYQGDDCTTKNRFIEKAIRSYSGYLDTESADAYPSWALVNVLEGKLGTLGSQTEHLLFKLSVDQNLTGNTLVTDIKIDSDQLRKVRVRCVKEVRKTNSKISFEDAVCHQKGAE